MSRNDNNEKYYSQPNSNISSMKKYLKYKSKYLTLKNKLNNNQKGGGSNKNTELYFIKAEWCSHCQTFKSEWAEIESNFKDNKNIKLITLDSDKDKEAVKNFKVSGFPTIILKSEGEIIEYEGARTKEELINFVNQYSK